MAAPDCEQGQQEEGQTNGPGERGNDSCAFAPIFFEGNLSQEAKWVGFGDHVCTVQLFEVSVKAFGQDVPFLEWVTFWYDTLMQDYPKEMKQMRTHFKLVPPVRPPSLSPNCLPI